MVTALDTSIPFSERLENFVLPNKEKIVSAVKSVLAGQAATVWRRKKYETEARQFECRSVFFEAANFLRCDYGAMPNMNEKRLEAVFRRYSRTCLIKGLTSWRSRR